jgi:hypothetical protein
MRKWEIREIKNQLIDIVEREHPITVRGAFYRAVSAGLFSNTDRNNYQRCVIYLKQLREVEQLDDDMFIDTTRIRHERAGFAHSDEYISLLGRDYGRDAWLEQPIHLELFSEKDALSSILDPVVRRYNLPFNIIRGNSSRKFLHDIGEKRQRIEKPIVALYAGDHDPSGINIARNTFQRLRIFARDRKKERFTWSKLAVTSGDFQRLQHLTISIKPTDKLAQRYVDEFNTTRALEVDAIPSQEIRDRLEKSILKRLDKAKWDHTLKEETEERDKLLALNRHIRGWGLEKAVEILGKDAPTHEEQGDDE